MSSSPPTAPPEPLREDIKQVEKKAVNQTLAQIRSLAAGATGGVCAVVVGHPFDLVKVRLQTAEKGIYSGAMDVVRKTVAREGLRRVSIPGGLSGWVVDRFQGLYAGVSAPLVGVTPMCKEPPLSIWKRILTIEVISCC